MPEMPNRGADGGAGPPPKFTFSCPLLHPCRLPRAAWRREVRAAPHRPRPARVDQGGVSGGLAGQGRADAVCGRACRPWALFSCECGKPNRLSRYCPLPPNLPAGATTASPTLVSFPAPSPTQPTQQRRLLPRLCPCHQDVRAAAPRGAGAAAAGRTGAIGERRGRPGRCRHMPAAVLPAARVFHAPSPPSPPAPPRPCRPQRSRRRARRRWRPPALLPPRCLRRLLRTGPRLRGRRRGM